MASQIVRFTGLSEEERKQVASLPRLAEGDLVELHVRQRDGRERALLLPPAAANVLETMLQRLLSGERVAVLAEDQELSPTEASTVLGISRPLVVHRMDTGELPFRYVGKHRRALLKDVLALKVRLDMRQKALDALAEDTEALVAGYGL